MNVSPLQNLIAEHIMRRLREMPEHLAQDVYAISLYTDVHDQELVFSVNTQTQVQAALAGKTKAYGLPTGEAEARWNYAFWMRETGSRFLTPPESEDARLWMALLQERGIEYSEDDDFDIEAYETSVTEVLTSLAVGVSCALHASGVIRKVFAKDIPIIVHQLEYYDATAEQTEAANPALVASEFVNWVRNGA